MFVAPAWFGVSQGAGGWRRVRGLICSCSQEVFADLLPELLLIYCSVIFPLVLLLNKPPLPVGRERFAWVERADWEQVLTLSLRWVLIWPRCSHLV